jgi:hypothetical protein
MGEEGRFAFGSLCMDKRQGGKPKSQAPSNKQIRNSNITMFKTEQIFPLDSQAVSVI